MALAPAAVFIWLMRQLPDVVHGHPVEQSFLMYIIAFMASMLGVFAGPVFDYAQDADL